MIAAVRMMFTLNFLQRRLFCVLAAALIWISSSQAGLCATDFIKEIQPILAHKCYRCHGPEKQQSGLRLDSRDVAFRGGEWGEPAVVPGDSAASLLIRMVTSSDSNTKMPPNGESLTADEIALLRAWIDSGAEWPDAANINTVPAGQKRELQITDSDRKHWAFRPLVHDDVTSGKLIDQLVSSSNASSEASREILVRRIYFDIWGLPPTLADVDMFVTDTAPDAFERLIDRLLASPRYGERWARHWLDVARYADSDGYESDEDRKDAWPYRDWVIRSLNDDIPFDTFVKWQIAGDELEPSNPDAVAATGFLVAGPSQTTTPADTEDNKLLIRYDELDDMVSTSSAAFLGLTVGCARCHDHKFDPIPTRDYYRLVATFASTKRQVASLCKPRRDFERYKSECRIAWREGKFDELEVSDEEKFWLRQPKHFFVPIQKELYERYGDQLKIEDDALRAWLSDDKGRVWDSLKHASEDINTNKWPAQKALIVADTGYDAEPSYLLSRGSVSSRVEPVTYGFLQIMSRGASFESYLKRPDLSSNSATDEQGWVSPPTTNQRSALAAWLVDVEHGAGPLLSRVAVNRIWQHHFGYGFTPTPNDIGLQGEYPTAPELLEKLAADFAFNGWQIKRLQKQILMSDAYRASVVSEQGVAPLSNPARRPIRLEAEALRDTMLAVSGRMNSQMYGSPFRPPIPAEAIATRSSDVYPADIPDGPAVWRRSIYAFTKRSVPNPWMEVFDAPDPATSCGRRNRATIPTQALTLLNNQFVQDCAADFAKRVTSEVGCEPDAQIERSFRLALGRAPRELELQQARAFLAGKKIVELKKSSDDETSQLKSLTDFCHLLFTLNEFAYVD